MNSYLFPVYTTTAVLLVYVTAILVGLNAAIIMFIFSVSPVCVIWMVYRVLTAKVEVKATFDEKWYEDQ